VKKNCCQQTFTVRICFFRLDLKRTLERKAQLPKKVGYQHSAQEQHTRDSDECEERVKRFFSRGQIARAYRMEIDQQAETETKDKAYFFDHGAHCIQQDGRCQASTLRLGDHFGLGSHCSHSSRIEPNDKNFDRGILADRVAG